MNEHSGGAEAVDGQADVLTHFTTLDQSLKCTVSSISSLPSSRGYLQSRQSTRVRRLGTTAAAQGNSIVEQSAPEGDS